MTTMKPSASLDYWRDYFRRGDSDIFTIIDHAIMVAATDYPNKFRSRRDKIAELLFSCRVNRCIGCDHLELSIPGDDEVNLGIAADDNGKESKANSSRGDNNHINYTYGEAETLSDAIEEFSVISKEVVKIKEILLNKENETNSVLLESLRKLKLISLNVDILKSTQIGKAVNSLRKHSSDQIRQLAKTLIAEWKEMVDQWVNTTKEITGDDEGTPESANPSVLDEEEAFPSLPYGVDIFTPNGFEFSHFFDSLDIDGNPCNSGAYDTSRELERSEGTQKRTQEAPLRSIKPSSATRRPLKQDTEQRIKKELVPTHKSERPMNQRKPVVTEQKRKAQQEVSVGTKLLELKGLDEDVKFECAKRKLQESYQQHYNSKKQRTIQVLETIPKQGSAQKPQLKRPGMSNRNWANGRK